LVVIVDLFVEEYKALLIVLFYGLHPIFTNYLWSHYGHSPYYTDSIFGGFSLDFLIPLPLFRIHKHYSWQTRRAGPSFWRSKNFLSFSSQYILISGIAASASTSRLGIARYAPVIFRRHTAYARSSSRTITPLFPGSYHASAP
jgi:hypothetical protein